MLLRWPLLSSKAAAVVACAAAVMAGSALLLAFDPNASDSLLPRCVFHLVTGLYCPGCGMTRALHALLHGDLAKAWAMNPLVVLMLAIAPLMAWHQLKLQPAPPARLSRLLMDGKLWIASLIVFGVLRNLPWSGFAWMAPG